MKPPVSIKGVLLVDGLVVLVRNDREEWELPGGRLEDGEEHARTLEREFAEELSLSVRLVAPIDSYLFEVLPGRHVFIITYGCALIGGFQPRVSEEHTAHCLWPVERLSEIKLPAGYRNSIETWAKTS
jgi:8-oxo-dGTP pyrophosphatase MutT (NUDIX family)